PLLLGIACVTSGALTPRQPTLVSRLGQLHDRGKLSLSIFADERFAVAIHHVYSGRVAAVGGCRSRRIFLGGDCVNPEILDRDRLGRPPALGAPLPVFAQRDLEKLASGNGLELVD